MGVWCPKTLKEFKESIDFELDGQTWKSAYATPSCACLGEKGLLAIRLLLLATWLACVVWSLVDWNDFADLGYWFTKLTHWGAVLELVYFGFAAFTNYMALYGVTKDGTGSATPWFVKATWFMFSFVPVTTFMVLILYWVLVYDGGTVEALSVIMHGGNFALVVVDFFVVRQPFYFSHLFMPIAFSAIYALFTLVYYLAGGTYQDGVSKYIYKSIDWGGNSAGTSSLLGLIVLVAVPVIYSATYCICGPCLPCCKRRAGEDVLKAEQVGADVIGSPSA